MSDGQTPVDVAVAVILKPDGSFLLAQRPPGKPYAGYWEFPGGKVERGESVSHALHRELLEELGIRVEAAYPWITRIYAYPHATVRLFFFRVARWRGDPHGHENQALAWQRSGHIDVSPLLPANAPVLRALALPTLYAITNASELGQAEFMDRLEPALASGLRLIQVREKEMGPSALRSFASRIVEKCAPHGAAVTVNEDWEMAKSIGAQGVHLTSRQLMALTTRPPVELCGASCHTCEDLERAVGLGVDFVVLGPVKPTRTHPDIAGMGWDLFSRMVSEYPLPVFPIGGLQPADLSISWQYGAHGICMQRGAWHGR